MVLLENGQLRHDDFVALEEGEGSNGRAALVPLARLLREQFPGETKLGVTLEPGDDPAQLRPHLTRLALVALRFPKHRDGRAFTQARALREKYGFGGEIRATGHVLPDQYAFLLRCGFSSVELPDEADAAVWHAARAVIPIAYQAAVTDEVPLSLLRRRIGGV
ncbi:DUF934 domain-containing protein [Roseomonas sp. F4]